MILNTFLEFLGNIFLFFFLMALIGVVRILWGFRTLLNNARRQAREQQQNQFRDAGVHRDPNFTQQQSSSTKGKKVFADNEGDYVDFEEVKE